MQQEAVKCDYFLWRDPEMCVYGLRVVSRLRKWHESLKLERELSGTQVSDEADKYKSEAERSKNEASISREEVQICLSLFMGDIRVVACISSISQPVQCI